MQQQCRTADVCVGGKDDLFEAEFEDFTEDKGDEHIAGNDDEAYTNSRGAWVMMLMMEAGAPITAKKM